MEKIKKQKSIILIGAGGHAESCVDLLNEQSKFKLKEIIGKNHGVSELAGETSPR